MLLLVYTSMGSFFVIFKDLIAMALNPDHSDFEAKSAAAVFRGYAGQRPSCLRKKQCCPHLFVREFTFCWQKKGKWRWSVSFKYWSIYFLEPVTPSLWSQVEELKVASCYDQKQCKSCQSGLGLKRANPGARLKRNSVITREH